jgi:hypothetical protein
MIELLYVLFPSVLVLFALELAWKATRFVVLYIAMRLGWRPCIYNEALAKAVAQQCLNDISQAQAAEGEPLDDLQREIMKDYGPWLIQIYTANYTLKKK